MITTDSQTAVTDVDVWWWSCLVGLLRDHPVRRPRLLPLHVADEVLGRRQVLPLGGRVLPGPERHTTQCISKGGRKGQVLQYSGCCTADSWADMGQNKLYKYQTITNSAPFRFLPCVLIVRVEGGVVAGGLRGQVERRGRRHRLPPGHCRSLSLHFIALEMYNFH